MATDQAKLKRAQAFSSPSMECIRIEESEWRASTHVTSIDSRQTIWDEDAKCGGGPTLDKPWSKTCTIPVY